MDKKTLLFVLFSLGLTACGGGSSSSNIVGSDADQRITVTSEGIREDVALSLYVNGTPTEETVISRNGQFAFEYLVSDGDTFVVNIEEPFPFDTECQLFNNGPATVGSAPLDIRLSCEQLASVRGTIYLQTAFQTDADINDINTDTANNNFFERAQEISSDLPFQGFVSRSSFDAPNGNYSNFPDRIDFLKVSLEKDQLISLKSIGYKDSLSDADLELYDENFQLVGRSSNIKDQIDLVTVSSNGTYYVVVEAVEGAVRYTLNFAAPSGGSRIFGATENIIPNQAIVQQRVNLNTRTSAASIASSVNHFDYTRTALAKFNFEEQQVRTASFESSDQLDNFLQQYQPKSYALRQTLKRIKELKQRADIALAEPNYRVTNFATPIDSAYNKQWHYPQINLEQAWDLETGFSSDVIVAVIDTGVWLSHEDLVGKFVPGYDFIIDQEASLDGDGPDDDPNDPGDQVYDDGSSSWHGTHVAGTIAANTNNDTGVAGVSWGAKIMPMRALGKGGGATYDIIQSVRFAAGLSNDSGQLPDQRADIINMSIGGAPYSQVFQDNINYARNAGVIIIAAAGNGEYNYSTERNEGVITPEYPASYDGVVSVGALEPFDPFTQEYKLASYSNFGPTLDLVAPGGASDSDSTSNNTKILSTFVDEDFDTGILSSGYEYSQGTSMAAPHVAGVAALMKSAYPELSPADFDILLRDGKLTSNEGLNNGNGDAFYFGAGQIDARKAVTAAQGLAKELEKTLKPKLVLTNSSIELTSYQLFSQVSLFNQGSESNISDISITGNDGSWLYISDLNTDSNGFGSYAISADALGLTEGQYEAEIIFTESKGSSISLTVTLSIEPLNLSVDDAPPVYVVLFSSLFGLVEQTVIAEKVTDGVYQFELLNVPPGNYNLLGGSDIDSNYTICEFAEICGAYPAHTAPTELTIQDTDINNIEFAVHLLNNVNLTADSMNAAISRTKAANIEE